MPYCVHQYPSPNAGSIGCSNLAELVHGGFVPIEFCSKCVYITSNPDKKVTLTEATHSPCTECPPPIRSNKHSYFHLPTKESTISTPKSSDWATVLTTAPRKDPTLKQCVDSIKYAGWEPTVFAEPDSIHLTGVKYILNQTRLGTWHNWLQSLRWALQKTTARYILSVQDDSLFHPDSRDLVERLMWPSKKTGFISLYTASHYSADLSGNLKPVGLNQITTGSLWGACALVFPRHVVEQILDHPITKSWLGQPPHNLSDSEKTNYVQHRKENPSSIQNVDTALGKVMNSLHLSMYCIDPSPVTHVATHSSINHGSNTGKRNCSRCANHNLPLVDQVFPTISVTPTVPKIGEAIKEVIETEIGYPISCNECLTYLKSLNSVKTFNLNSLSGSLYTHMPMPNEWRKKYVGKTGRLNRISSLIAPLFK